MSASEPILLDGAPRGLSAGAISRALHSAYGLPVEAVGTLAWRLGTIELQVDARQARRLMTPCPLAVGATRVVLRRPSDLCQPPEAWTLAVGPGPALSAGALAVALTGVRGEDVGALRGSSDGSVRIELDRWRYREQDLPQVVAGRPALVEKDGVEKKKPRRLTRRTADSASEALERALAGRLDPERLRAVTRQALARAGTDPRLGEAVRRLAKVGFAPPPPAPAADPGLLLLTLALAPRQAWLDELERLDATPFPTPEDRAAREAVAGLESELRSLGRPSGPLELRIAELAAAHGLETRAGGTLLPGLRALGVSLDPVAAPSSGEDLMSRWLAIAAALASPSGVDPSAVRTLDRDARAAAGGGDLGRWPELMALVLAEAAGAASPSRTSLEEAVPGTPRYEDAAVRHVDHLVLGGRFQEASAAAQRAAKAGAASPRLARRLLRLGARIEPPAGDPVSRVLHGEALWRAGRRLEAQLSFQGAHPMPGSPAALHAAARLLAQGQAEAAWSLLTPDDDPALRLRAAVATSRWAEAAEAWAEASGSGVGLDPTPEWADAAIRLSLPGGLCAVLEGRLGAALESLPPGRVRALCEQAIGGTLPPTPEVASSADPVSLVFDTPDPRPALRALGRIDAGRGLLLRLVRELDGWDVATLSALGGLPAERRRELVATVPEATWLDWLEGKDPALRGAAVGLVGDLDDLPVTLVEALGRTPERRVDAARALLAEDRRDEAAQVAASAFRKAGTPALRRECLRVVAATDRWSAIEALLDPARDAHVHDDVLAVLLETGAPESLAAAVQRLTTDKLERVRLAASRILAKATWLPPSPS